MLARSRCRLHWLRLAQVPAAERAAALQVQALAWQPFEDCARVLLLQGENGLVIGWDRAAAEADLRAAGLDPQRHPLTPETLLRAQQANGLHLLRMAEGCEAQQWQDGRLQASRWWPQPPTEADWIQFLRSLPGQDAQQALPAVAEAPVWQARPWQTPLPSADGALQAREREHRLVGLGALAFALAAGFVGAQTLQVERAVHQQQQANQALRAQLEPVLKQRERALGQAAEAAQWAAWLRAPLPLDLLQHLHELLGKRQVLLREFELRGDTLRLGLQAPVALPRAELIRALQSGHWLGGVTEVRGESARDLLWLEAKLRGTEPAAAAAAPVAPPPAPTLAVAPAVAPAVASPTPAPAAQAAAPGAQAAAPARPPASSPPRARTPLDDMPPASVFDAIK